MILPVAEEEIHMKTPAGLCDPAGILTEYHSPKSWVE